MKLRNAAIFIAALAIAATPSFADPVDLSSLRYDFGAGASLASFAVGNGVNPDPNDSFDATMTFDVALGSNNKHALTADVWGSETDLTGFASLDLTIEVDPASALDTFGNHGFYQIAGRNTDGYDYIQLAGFNLAPGTSIISLPLDQMNAARALTFDHYGGPEQDIMGDVIYSLIDARLVPVPEPACGLLVLSLFAGISFFRRR